MVRNASPLPCSLSSQTTARRLPPVPETYGNFEAVPQREGESSGQRRRTSTALTRLLLEECHVFPQYN
ncbi:hypothetical protein CEXT_665401 [Caerostris extrusa]|uniref:Uncharacterized protein n=1 Tax=Caerostris extrusa TaxID=172846 RepID=A0AAV4XN59_CAEEX|nr:hypothetical protein CEXT_665401 [Caerostris extrusa]